jgi:hypothetical protein
MHFIVALSVAASPTFLEGLRQTFDPSTERVKANLPCKSAWREAQELTANKKKYTSLTCADENQQLMVSDGKVFGVGVPVEYRVDSRRADVAMKRSQSDLAAQGCVALRKDGQLAVFECAGNFAVVLLSNWNSKDDTNTVSALFGSATELLPALGMPTKKK